MKAIISLTLMLLVSLGSYSQNLCETNIDNDLFLCLDMKPETQGYKDIKVLFAKKNAKQFIKKLKEYCANAEKWSKSAKEHNIKNFRKAMTGTINFNHLEFKYDESNNTSEGYFMVPSFDCDSEGNCYLLLRGYYKGRNITPYLVTFREGDKVRYQQLSEFNYYLRIPANELESWYGKVEQAVNSYEVNEDNYASFAKNFEEK